MVQQTPRYSLVLVAFVLACGLTYWMRLKPVHAVFDADLASLPINVGVWQGKDMPLDRETRGSLSADEIISRVYSDGSPDGIGLLVVYRKYGRREFAHRPEMCYPAAGYEIVGKEYAKVPYGGKAVNAIKVIAQKEDEREVVVYWFASGYRTEANYVKQQLWMSLDRLRPRKYGWAFIRVHCPVLYSDEDTMERIRTFLDAASGPMAQCLSRSRSRPGGRPK